MSEVVLTLSRPQLPAAHPGDTMSQISEPMLDLVDRIASALPRGTRMQFATVERAPRLQNRVDAGSDTQVLIESARKQRLEHGSPFWQALFHAGGAQDDGVPDEIIQAALYHQSPSADDELTLTAGIDSPSTLLRLAASVDENDVLMLTLRVLKPDGLEAHIPLLDFSIKSRLQGARISALRAARALNVPGELTSTGRSFHYFGLALVSEREWRQYMARALLLAPITDERWIAHQLLAGYASLRISGSDKGESPVPLGTI
jgi:hypothetical protein